MTVYRQEFLSSCFTEILSLSDAEWEESGHKDLPLSVDVDRYYKLEEEGCLKVFTARSETRLVGYITCIVSTLLTNKGTVVGYLDAVYVVKDFRGSSVGKNLYLFAEKCLKEDSINRVVASSSAKNPIHKFLVSLGYEETETKYDKVL